MPGIIITPGTFNAPATPLQIRGNYGFPQTPVVTLRRRWLQHHTRPRPLVEQEEEIDESAMVVDPVDLWLAAISSTVWLGSREITMDLKWRDLPPEVTHVQVNGGTAILVSAPSAPMRVDSSVRATDTDWVIPTTGYDVWAPLVDGLNLFSDGPTTHPSIPYEVAGDPHELALQSGDTNSVIITWLASGTPVGNFFVTPKYQTTARLRDDAEEIVPQISARAIYLMWTAADGYFLRMPAGFLYTAF